MVISTNPKPDLKDFVSLLKNTTDALNTDVSTKEEYFISKAGNKLEGIVCEAMRHIAKGSQFEGTIELISGQRFPDIVANRFYGVEVKSTTQNHWKTTGNSVLESTRVADVERIYMFFGKLAKPVEFRYRPYEECLADIVVTHSPRYLINMNLNDGETIFDKLSLPYDTLRTMENPIRPIVDYYKAQLKDGEELWWMDSGKVSEEAASNIAIRLWNNISAEERNSIAIGAMACFPELFGKHKNKYKRLAVWLVSKYGIVSPSLRDSFTAGGQFNFDFKGVPYKNVPKVFEHLINSAEDVFIYLLNQSNFELSHYWWNARVNDKNKIMTWIELVSEHSKTNKFDPTFILLEKLKGMGLY